MHAAIGCEDRVPHISLLVKDLFGHKFLLASFLLGVQGQNVPGPWTIGVLTELQGLPAKHGTPQIPYKEIPLQKDRQVPCWEN